MCTAVFGTARTLVSTEKMQALPFHRESYNRNTSLKICTYISLLDFIAMEKTPNPAAFHPAAHSPEGCRQLAGCCTKPHLSARHPESQRQQNSNNTTQIFSSYPVKTKLRRKPTNEGKRRESSGWLTPPRHAVSRITYSKNEDVVSCASDNCSMAPALELQGSGFSVKNQPLIPAKS